jgi:MFS family permease
MTNGPDAGSRESERLAPAPPVPQPPRRRRERLRRAVSLATLDVAPLRRHREYRLLFTGMGVSLFGSMLTYVAIPFQVYELTGSSLMVGLVSLAELVPLLVMPFVGGALADAGDRRRLVWLSELGLAVGAAILLVNALLPTPQLAVLFVVAAAMAALDGIQRPSLDALTPRLVSRDELPAASALDSLRMNVGTIGGPAIAGLLIATIGLPATYGLDIATFLFSLGALAMMRAVPPPANAERPSIRGILDGIRYARGRQELVGTYAVDIVAMFFGMPMALYPAFATEFGGPGVLGLLYAAPSVGALAATLTSGWVSRVRRHGMAVIVAATCWGIGITAFGLAPSLPIALAALAFAGGADMVSGIFRGTIWNQTIPDHLRGRLAGIEQVSYTSGPLLGNVESGVAAALFGVRGSIVSGGVLCVVGVIATAALLPLFRAYDARAGTAGAPQPAEA